MKTFYKNENGIVRVMQTADDKASTPNGWKETKNHDLYKYDGEKIEWFDKDMNRIPDSVLVEKGLRIDNRGCWYHTDNPQETKMIYNMDENPGDNWTQEKPAENELYQKFDEKKWLVDTKKKERAEKQNELGELKCRIEEAERRQIRPMKAIIRNEATKDDTDKFNEYEEIIQELRPKITVLENELKIA
jgi:hypothetical protein